MAVCPLVEIRRIRQVIFVHNKAWTDYKGALSFTSEP